MLAVAAAAGAGPAPDDDSHPHLIVVPADGDAAAALAKAEARVIARYEGFTLVEASGKDAERLVRAGADLRDDMRQVTIDRKSFDPARGRRSLARKRGGSRQPGFAVVQFVGPIKDAWLARVRKTGVRVVIYMAQNGYLVHGSAKELDRVAKLVGADPAVRAVVPYTAADKLRAGVRSSGKQRLAVQTLSGSDGAAGRDDVVNVGTKLRATSAVGPFRTQYVVADAAQAEELARDPGVVAIEPSSAPELFDEAQDQLLAGNTTGTDPLLPSGTGYLSFVDGLVGTTTFPFSVDVTDEGIDAGVVGTTHADLQVGGGGATRLDYVDDWTSDPNAMDCGGHGTINAGIVGGFNTGTGAAFEDASGFNYGLGIAPRTKLGGSKIFTCSGAFSLVGTFTALTTNAYNKGARISSNSWGCGGCAASYNTDSQEYDKLVRDAVPGTPGNQEMVEIFAAGNDGSGANTIGTPGNGKNVITVGASENVRASGTDGCGVTNSGADDAHDIINFSSRGPAPTGRLKPDIVGPGTHVVGTAPQHGSYTGGGVCTQFFPAGQTLYSLSSGTSHSTPALSGVAALFRQWYTNGPGSGTPPSPALTKAVLAQSGTDLVGGANGAGGSNTNVPNTVQGWGLANIQRALDSVTPRYHRDQQDVFGATGENFVRTFAVQDTGKPVRVTLAFSDAFGPTGTNPVVNDLNLTVNAGTGTFKGNVFSGGLSASGGTADAVNSLESVYLPAGTSGNFAVEVSAANIAGDGVPGNADSTDQDFALTVFNAAEVNAPALTHQSTSVSDEDLDGALEPGESFGVAETIRNAGTASASGISGTMTGPGSVSITDGTAAWPNLATGASAANADPLAGTLSAGATCGAPVQLSVAITSTEGATANIPITVQTGTVSSPVARNSADVPKAIPDNNAAGVNSILTVAEAGTIKDVNVRIGSLTHTWVGDLTVDITSPAGTVVNLVSRPGGANNNDNNLVDVVFDDEAPTAIGPGNPVSNATPAYTGSFRPQADQLSRFDAEPQNGTWTLKVSDLFAADTGTLNTWGHDISPAACSFTASPPGAIAGLTATAGVEQVALNWDDTPTATGYKVYRKAGGVYPGTPTATPSTSSFTDTGRTAGVEECYKVQATNDSGDGPMSGEICATPLPQPPGAITGLAASGGVEQVALNWDDTPTATGYKVYRKAGGVYPGTPTATPSSSNFTDTGRSPGTEYCYKVQATGAGGDGPMSGEVCATTAPGTIANLVATGGVEQVALNWDDTATATGYKLYRRNPDGVTYPGTPTATPSTSNFTDTGRTAGVEDCYKVQATNDSGDGPMSGEVCATPTSAGSPPGAVTSLTATAGVEQVALDWDDTPTASDYYVWRLNPDGSQPALPTATVTPSQYTDTGRPAGIQQCYKVEARNAVGSGPLSGQVCATPQAAGTGGGGTGGEGGTGEGGTGEGGPGGGTPEIPIPPKLDLSGIPGTVKVNAKGRFTLAFSSSADGTLALTSVKAFAAARRKKRKQTLARTTFTAPANEAVTLRLKLKKKHFKLLKKKRKLKVTAKAAAGELSSSKTFKLKAPKPRKKKR